MTEETKAAIVYATFPDLPTATQMAGTLVKARLAACVNLLPNMTSHYRWRGEVETAQEVVMIAKTRAALADGVIKAIEAGHPYDTPAAITLEIAGGSKRYLDWIKSETVNPASDKS